jgi:hypothetical protein
MVIRILDFLKKESFEWDLSFANSELEGYDEIEVLESGDEYRGWARVLSFSIAGFSQDVEMQCNRAERGRKEWNEANKRCGDHVSGVLSELGL